MKVRNDTLAMATRARNQEKKVIENNEKRIKKINDEYNRLLANTKMEGENRLNNQREQSNRRLNTEYQNMEKKLKNFDQKIQDVEKSVQLREDNIVEQNKIKLYEMEDANKQKYDTLNRNITERLNNLQKKAKLSRQRLQNSNTRTLKQINREGQSNQLRLSLKNQKMLANERASFKEKDIQNKNRYNDILLTQKRDHEKTFEHNQKRHLQQVSIQQGNNKKIIDAQKKQFDAKIKDSHKKFMNKYSLIQKSHKELTDNLQKRIDNDIKDLKRTFVKTYKTIENKGEDPFYRISSLTPKVTDKEKYYEVNIKVPEHEKNFVKISGNKRNIKIEHSRSFHDQVGTDGVKDKIYRSESYVKEFPVSDIIDARKVDKSYSDGTLTFKVYKA